MRIDNVWKLATFCLAAISAILLFFLVRGPTSTVSGNPTASVDRNLQTLPPSIAKALRSLRGSPGLAGLSEAETLAELKRQTNPRKIVVLCRKLGYIGRRDSVLYLQTLVDDRRPGISSAAIKAIGTIGNDSALDFLLEYERTGNPGNRRGILSALATTQSQEAKDRLLEIVLDPVDQMRTSAMFDLVEFGGQDVIDALLSVVTGDDYTAKDYAITTLSMMTEPAAIEAMNTLIYSTDFRVRSFAIENLEDFSDPAVRAHLMGVLAAGNDQGAVAAAIALGNAGATEAIPLLGQVAQTGSIGARKEAVMALGKMPGPKARKLLAGLLASGDGTVVSEAAYAIAEYGDSAAREVLLLNLEAAGSGRGAALSALTTMRGPDIEAAMVRAAREGSEDEKQTALHYLADGSNPEGRDLVILATNSGNESERNWAIELLSESGHPEAREALLEVARASTGASQIDALSILMKSGNTAAAEPILRQVFLEGSPEQKQLAAAALAQAGTPGIGEFLIEALASDDPAVVFAAAEYATEVDGSEEMRTALLESAQSSDSTELQSEAMKHLLKLGAPEGVELARELIANAEGSDSWAVVSEIAYIDTPEAHQLMLEASQSDNAAIRGQTASYLSGSDESTQSALFELVDDAEEDVRHTALKSLAESGTAKGAEHLLRLAQDETSPDRVAAIQAMEDSSDKQSRAVIFDSMVDADDDVATVAIEIARGNTSDRQALREILKDKQRSKAVRAAVAERMNDLKMKLDSEESALIESILEEDESSLRMIHTF